MVASMCWAMGAIFNRHARKPGSPLLAIGMQMFAGGALSLVVALVSGEASTFSLGRITGVSLGAWSYLTVMGSLVGFTSYVWLLQVSTPARVSTSAYVNPLIAVLLGCTIGREAVTPDLFIAGGLIIVAVAFIVRSGARSGATSKVGAAATPTPVPVGRSR
jgi:drug/metabolite transporter (DMT)-like permease